MQREDSWINDKCRSIQGANEHIPHNLVLIHGINDAVGKALSARLLLLLVEFNVSILFVGCLTSADLQEEEDDAKSLPVLDSALFSGQFVEQFGAEGIIFVHKVQIVLVRVILLTAAPPRNPLIL